MSEFLKILREAMPEIIGGLVVAGVLAAISALLVRWRTKRKESVTVNNPLQSSSGKPILPQDLMLKITVPEGFDVRGPNRFLKFSKWLSNPLREGDNPGSFEYPIEGQVMPSITGLVVGISIRTNQWWPQGKCWVRADGTFSGTVFLDQRLEPAIFRFDILNTDGQSLKRFDVSVE